MKTFLKKTALAVIGIGLIAVCGESSSIIGQVIWSGSWLSAMAVAVVILRKTEEAES